MIAILYDLLFILPLSFAVCPVADRMFTPEELALSWIPTTILTVVYLVFLIHFKSRGRKWLIGILAAVFCAFFLLQPAEDRLDLFRSHDWLFYELLIAAACFFVGLLLNRFRKARIVAVAAAVAFLAASLALKIEMGKFTVCMIVLYILLAVADEIQRRSVKEGDTEPKKHLIFVSPFLLALILLTGVLKTPDKPYDWKFVRDIIKTVQSSLIRLNEMMFPETGWDSPNPVIGFSDRGLVGGDLTKAEHTVMELRDFMDNEPYLYLSGKVFDTFDGHIWDKTDYSSLNERALDTLETFCAVGEKYSKEVLKRTAYEMEYKDMATKSFFVPPKYIPGRSGDLIVEGADLSFEDQKASRGIIDMVYYRFKRDNPLLYELLNRENTVTKEDWDKTLDYCGLTGTPGVSYEDYLSYRELISEYYLPKTELSPELKSTMEKVLDGAETDYEKLLRLEQMFKGFTYTDHPGQLPESIKSASDFLDYFILEKREGYCTYYATAFTLLARAEGIPARFAQGYRVPVGRALTVEVSSSYTHAWPECYIDGIGWIIFEPTPGYQNSSMWMTSENAGKKEEAEESPLPALKDTEEDEETEEEKPAFVIRWYQIVIPAMVGLLFILIWYALDRFIRKRRFESMTEKDKCLLLCRRNMDLLKRCRISRENGETLAEFKDRAEAVVPEEDLTFFEIYEDLLYSKKEAGEQDRLMLEETGKKLKKLKRRRKQMQASGVSDDKEKE